MRVFQTRHTIAVFVFSLVAAFPFAVTVWNLRDARRIERLFAGEMILRDGTVERVGQREINGHRALFVEYSWNVEGIDYRKAAELNIPAVIQPAVGDRILLYSDPADPSFALPVKAFRDPTRPGRLKLLAGLFTLPPLFLWGLLGWSVWQRRKQRADPV